MLAALRRIDVQAYGEKIEEFELKSMARGEEVVNDGDMLGERHRKSLLRVA